MTDRSGLSRRGLLGAVAGVTAATALPAAPAWGTDDQRPGAVNRPKLDKYDRQIVSGLSSDRALRHLQVLSEDIGPRIGGTTSEKRAADYLAGQLDKFGYRTRLEPFGVLENRRFYVADPDCVGVTRAVPWTLTRQWLDLVARSGTMLSVSIAADALGAAERRDLRTALALAAVRQPVGEPLDWERSVCPARWRLSGRERSFDWIGPEGAGPP